MSESSGHLKDGGVAQQVVWKGIPKGANGVILSDVQFNYSQNGVTGSISRTEAWVVENGHVYSYDNGVKTLSKSDEYIIGAYNQNYPDKMEWTGNMVFLPDATLNRGYFQSSSSPNDLSKGMLYHDGLLFPLNGNGGITRNFSVTNDRANGQWVIQTSTANGHF